MTPEECAHLRKKHYNAAVLSIRRAHEDLFIARIRPDFPVPPHKPGQYSTLGLGHWEPRHPGCQEETPKPDDEKKLIRRAYSLSSSILDERHNLLDLPSMNWLEFYIVLVRQAAKNPPALTPRLFLLNEGDRLFLGEKITGHYTLDPVKPGDAVVFLSTGTGEAPHNYMVWELLRRGHAGPILAACCVRYRQDLAYRELQEPLMRRYPNYRYLALTTREADTVDHKVYIQDLITSGQLEERLGRPLDPEHAHVYLCGNPKMIGVPTVDRATGQSHYPEPTGVIEILEKRRFRIDQHSVKLQGTIHFEEYW
jgi:ferredoxin/flavodoxin---NADP+ reductase